MAILRNNELEKMSKKELENKLKDLKMELVKAYVAANKTNSKTKEIKRAIARIITFSSKKVDKPLKELENK
jgi:ribosomal protein L29